MTRLNNSCSETASAIAMCNRRVGKLQVARVILDLFLWFPMLFTTGDTLSA